KETLVPLPMIVRTGARAAVVLACAASALAAQQKCPAMTPGAKMPLTYRGGATAPEITACDLMTRLYIYAADSMRGREAGTADALRPTAYIAREVSRLGLKAAGDNGTYFQYLPVTSRSLAKTSTITAGGKTFHAGTDFTAAGGAADRSVS